MSKYIKTSKNLSAKYYQENKEKLQKQLAKDIKIFLKKNKKSDNMVVNVTEDFQKMKNKSLLSIEKNTIEQEEMLYSFLSFICNYYSEKESLKSRKINCNSSSKIRIVGINKYLSWLVFGLFVINT